MIEEKTPLKSVVIIDDDINQLLLLEKFLGNERYKISKFTGAKEALETLDETTLPDLIITDLFMPDIDGWRLCRLLRSSEYKEFNNVPILVVSATFSGDDAAKITADTGANAFLSMPADKKSLISTVEAMLKNDHCTGRQKVLIVEDSKTLTKILKAVFEVNSYDAHIALTAGDARKKFETTQYDFAVIDYHLPDGDGETLLSEFQAIRPDTVIIMITTDSNPELALDWLQKGASSFLRKPFTPEYLVELCAKAAREKSLLRVEKLLEEKTKLLHESEQRWQYALEGVEDGLWDWNLQTNEVYFSRHWKEMLGYDVDEIGNGLDEWDNRVHPDDREECYEELDQHLKGKTSSYKNEHRILCKDGTYTWVLDRGKVIEWTAEGKPLRIIGTHTDITDRKQAETEAAESHKRLITILNSIDAFIYVADMQTHELLFVNRYGQQASGNIEGKKCWKVIQSGQTGPCPFCSNDKLLDSEGSPKGVYQWEFRNLKNGRWYDCRDIAIRWIDGRIVRLEIATDITDRKHAEDELKAANTKLEALWNISSLEDADFKVVCDHVLETIVRMTGSLYGFYGFLNPEESVMTIHSWSGEAMKGCGIVDKPQEFSISEAGLWAEAVRKRKPLIFNNYSEKNPAKKGCPEAHVPIENLLVVPFMAHKRIITVAAVANSTSGYTAKDVAQITTFLRGIQAITERMEAEISLRESERRFRELFDNSRDGFVVVDAEGRFQNANPAYCKMLGYTLAELKQMKNFYEITPERWREWEQKEVWEKRLLQEGYSKIYEKEYIRRDGTVFPVELQSYALFDDGGRLQYLWGIARDITERKKAEEELTNREKQLTLTTDNFPGLVSILDTCFRFKFVSKGFERIFNITPEQVVGKTIREFIGEDRYAVVEPNLKQALHGRIISYESSSMVPSGKVVYGLNTIVPDFDEKGNVSQFFVFGIDITRQKQLEEARLELERQLLHTQKLESLGVLAGGIAHDFNNLLLAIIGNLDMSLYELSPVSASRKYIESSMTAAQRAAAQRAADLTRQMLAYSGRGHFVMKDVDINKLIKENVHILKSSVSKNAVFQLNLDPDIPSVLMDTAQIQQIIMNLITNASEAIGETTGNITLTTGTLVCDDSYLKKSRANEKPHAGKFVYLEVSDTGCGMDEETIQRLFEPFFTTKFTGRGLGMAAVIGIVRGHKGAVFVDSEPENGTVVRVLLPASQKKTGVKTEKPVIQPHEETAGDISTKTVLIVDDEEDVLDMCNEMVMKFGYKTLTAKNGVEAVEIYKIHFTEICCVILDLSMPRMGGRETFLELKKIDSGVKVILSSGYDREEATIGFEGQGLAGFIHKPYSLNGLKEEIKRAVG